MKTFTEPGYEFSPFGPPRSTGVYVVCCCKIKANGGFGKPKPLYIGSAKNIYTRVMGLSHPYRVLFNSSGKRLAICLAYKNTTDYLEEEIRMIRKYSPKYNTIYKSITL